MDRERTDAGLDEKRKERREKWVSWLKSLFFCFSQPNRPMTSDVFLGGFDNNSDLEGHESSSGPMKGQL